MSRASLVIAFLLASAAARSQTWCPPGATWHYRILENNVGQITDGTTKITVNGTTTVNNHTCVVLDASFHGARYMFYETPSVAVTPAGTYHTYEEAGVIYIAHDNHFDTIVNMNASPGDKWYSVFGDGNCNLPREWLQVVDTSHVLINAVSLKRVRAHTQLSSLPTVEFVGRLGCITGFMFMRQPCAYDQPSDGMFSCYKDDAFPLYMRQGVSTCDEVTVGLAESVPLLRFPVFPNPANDRATISAPGGAMVTINDVLGNCVRSFVASGDAGVVVDVGDLAAGVYSVSFGLFRQTEKFLIAR